MKWIVNIEGKKNQRIKVTFEPKEDMIHFVGQYKPHNLEWVDFSEEIHPIQIDLEQIQNCLAKAYDKMKERLEAYENVAEGFTIIKNIEIAE